MTTEICHENENLNTDVTLNHKEDLFTINTDLSQWMTNLPIPLTKIPLNQLAIPGSHDSGAYYLDPDTPISPGQPAYIRRYGKILKSIIINWSLTQSYSISRQLNNGVRYFDMRPGYLESKNDFLFVHGVYGHTISDLLNEMRAFLLSNPREVVIIDFNHFYSFTKDLHHRFIGNVLSTFEDMIYPNHTDDVITTSAMTSSLSSFWALNKQVVIRYTHDKVAVNYKELYPKCSIFSPWFNRDSSADLIKDLNSRFSTLRPDALNIFQAILTPRTKTVVLHPRSSLYENLVITCNLEVKKWLRRVHTNRVHGANIVICDFICMDQCCKEIIRLNEIIDT